MYSNNMGYQGNTTTPTYNTNTAINSSANYPNYQQPPPNAMNSYQQGMYPNMQQSTMQSSNQLMMQNQAPTYGNPMQNNPVYQGNQPNINPGFRYDQTTTNAPTQQNHINSNQSMNTQNNQSSRWDHNKKSASNNFNKGGNTSMNNSMGNKQGYNNGNMGYNQNSNMGYVAGNMMMANTMVPTPNMISGPNVMATGPTPSQLHQQQSTLQQSQKNNRSVNSFNKNANKTGSYNMPGNKINSNMMNMGNSSNMMSANTNYMGATTNMMTSDTNMMGTSTNMMGTGTNMMGTGTNMMGTSPNMMGTGPAIMGTGPNVMGTGPNVMGTGTNMMGTGTNMMGTGTNMIGTGTNMMGTGTNMMGTGTNMKSTSNNMRGSGANMISTGRNTMGTGSNRRGNMTNTSGMMNTQNTSNMIKTGSTGFSQMQSNQSNTIPLSNNFQNRLGPKQNLTVQQNTNLSISSDRFDNRLGGKVNKEYGKAGFNSNSRYSSRFDSDSNTRKSRFDQNEEDKTESGRKSKWFKRRFERDSSSSSERSSPDVKRPIKSESEEEEEVKSDKEDKKSIIEDCVSVKDNKSGAASVVSSSEIHNSVAFTVEALYCYICEMGDFESLIEYHKHMAFYTHKNLVEEFKKKQELVLNTTITDCKLRNLRLISALQREAANDRINKSDNNKSSPVKSVFSWFCKLCDSSVTGLQLEHEKSIEHRMIDHLKNKFCCGKNQQENYVTHLMSIEHLRNMYDAKLKEKEMKEVEKEETKDMETSENMEEFLSNLKNIEENDKDLLKPFGESDTIGVKHIETKTVLHCTICDEVMEFTPWNLKYHCRSADHYTKFTGQCVKQQDSSPKESISLKRKAPEADTSEEISVVESVNSSKKANKNKPRTTEDDLDTIGCFVEDIFNYDDVEEIQNEKNDEDKDKDVTTESKEIENNTAKRKSTEDKHKTDEDDYNSDALDYED